MNKATRKKNLVPALITVAAAAASVGLSTPALAAEVTRIYVVEVPAPKDHAFREGVVAWHACERANGNHSSVLVYDAETGDVGRYAFLDVGTDWAQMDRKNPAEKACSALFRDSVLPNVSSATSEILQENSKLSYMPGGDPDPAPMVWVNAFRIKPGHGDEFHAGLEKFAAAAAKTRWQGHFTGYDVMGAGAGGEDFLLVWPNKNWADIGTDPNPSIKDMMNSVYGKSAAEASHKRFFDSVAADWADAWSYDKTLSATPEK